MPETDPAGSSGVDIALDAPMVSRERSIGKEERPSTSC